MKKENIRKHLGILLTGFIHAVEGTAASVLLFGGILLLTYIPIESGYFAVGKFIAALLVFGFSGWMFYPCGKDLLIGRFTK